MKKFIFLILPAIILAAFLSNNRAVAANPSAIRQIPLKFDPFFVVQDGPYLYLTDCENADSITVMDVSKAGQESVVGKIKLPSNNLISDIKAGQGFIFVAAMLQDKMNHLFVMKTTDMLSGGTWQEISLPYSLYSNQEAYNLINLASDKPYLYLSEFDYNNRVSMVDVITLPNFSHVGFIKGLDYGSSYIASQGDTLAILSTWLQGPSCDAVGPELSIYNLHDLSLRKSVNLQGHCSEEMVIQNNQIAVSSEVGVTFFDDNGNQTSNQPLDFDPSIDFGVDGSQLIVADTIAEQQVTNLLVLQNGNTCNSFAFPTSGVYPNFQHFAYTQGEQPRLFVPNTGTQSLFIVDGYNRCQ